MHVTLKLTKMKYAVMDPVLLDMNRAIPPPNQDDVPAAFSTTQEAEYVTFEAHRSVVRDFEQRALQSHHSEWVWHTFEQRVWTNTWHAVSSSTGSSSQFCREIA